MTLPLHLYSGLSRLAAPFLARRIAGRLRAQGVRGERPWERLGHPTIPRPDGPLLWFHGASVGEGLALLPLVERCRAAATCLVTTGTAASAEVLARRLPEGALHQFAPLDSAPVLMRFLDHWRPGALVLAESEIWPETLRHCAARGIPAALVGARLSAGSARGWARMPASARALFGGLALVHPQSAEMATRLRALGAREAALLTPADLKAASDPLPPGEAEALAPQLAGRPVWAMVSTHPGEEEIALAAHEVVREHHPDALLLLVPRHPERAERVAALIARTGLDVARRSAGEVPGRETAVWLCDTLGETGTWFRLAQVVALAGSWRGAGGHNPWEAALLDRGILHGPDVANAAGAHAALDAAGGALEVPEATLGENVAMLLADPDRRAAMGRAARETAAAQVSGADDLARRILALAGIPR